MLGRLLLIVKEMICWVIEACLYLALETRQEISFTGMNVFAPLVTLQSQRG